MARWFYKDGAPTVLQPAVNVPIEVHHDFQLEGGRLMAVIRNVREHVPAIELRSW